MRPKTVTVTSGNSPYYIPVSWVRGAIGVTATPAGAGNYDVAYTHESITDGASNVTTWTDITDMSGTGSSASKEVGPCTCLRITLNSGTSVTVDVVQQAA